MRHPNSFSILIFTGVENYVSTFQLSLMLPQIYLLVSTLILHVDFLHHRKYKHVSCNLLIVIADNIFLVLLLQIMQHKVGIWHIPYLLNLLCQSLQCCIFLLCLWVGPVINYKWMHHVLYPHIWLDSMCPIEMTLSSD